MSKTSKGPVLIELEEDAAPPAPDRAPPVPDASPPKGRAMQTVAILAARPTSRLARWFWGLLLALTGIWLSVAAWDFATGLIARMPVLGWAVAGLAALLIMVLLAIAVKELTALSRLRRIDGLHRRAEAVLAGGDLMVARAVTARLKRLYQGREDAAWGLSRLAERESEVFDAPALLALAEIELLTPLDEAARTEVEAAARQVATVTALVPLALADVVAALTANLRMIRRVAAIYGGRAGTLGSWRLARAVMAHLVATGAVALGDDMLGSVAGGGLLSKLSRRFGEGLVNGALTARVGLAAMEVCRPLPFTAGKRPSVSGVVKRALTGLFSSG